MLRADIGLKHKNRLKGYLQQLTQLIPSKAKLQLAQTSSLLFFWQNQQRSSSKSGELSDSLGRSAQLQINKNFDLRRESEFRLQS